MRKTCNIPDLPIGTGAALGSFIRSLYLTAAKRYAIIGISVDNLGFFDTLGANSAMVNDLIQLLVSKEYVIRKEVINAAHLLGDTTLGPVYVVTINKEFAKEITREHFSSVLSGESTDSIKLTEPVKLSISFYICEVTGIIKENLVSVALNELKSEKSFILPISCSGKHISKVWSTYTQHKFHEDLTIHIEGPDEIIDADIQYLLNLYSEYVLKAADGLDKFVEA